MPVFTDDQKPPRRRHRSGPLMDQVVDVSIPTRVVQPPSSVTSSNFNTSRSLSLSLSLFSARSFEHAFRQMESLDVATGHVGIVVPFSTTLSIPTRRTVSVFASRWNVSRFGLRILIEFISLCVFRIGFTFSASPRLRPRRGT